MNLKMHSLGCSVTYFDPSPQHYVSANNCAPHHFAIGGKCCTIFTFFNQSQIVLGGAKPRMQWWCPCKKCWEDFSWWNICWVLSIKWQIHWKNQTGRSYCTIQIFRVQVSVSCSEKGRHLKSNTASQTTLALMQPPRSICSHQSVVLSSVTHSNIWLTVAVKC